MRDVRLALRGIRKAPGFAVASALTLALGIGANTAIFSVLNAVLLRPLPYPQPERLVRIWQSEPKIGERHMGAAAPEFVSYRERTRAFSSVAGYEYASYDLTGDRDPEHITGCQVSASLLRTLGVAPMIGRSFTRAEELPDAARVVILSYRYWQSRYGGNPQVPGTTIRLNEQPYQVIGVMPRGFTFPAGDTTPGAPPELWTPLSFTPAQLRDWASSFDVSMIGRLRDGITMAQAREDVRRVAGEFQKEQPGVYSGTAVLDASVEEWKPAVGELVPTALGMLTGAVAFVLLIACANVANLLLTRAGVRQREISIRRALGASPGRLMRQVFAESAVLAVAGGAAGCGLAVVLIRVMGSLWKSGVNLSAVTLDARMLLFTLGLAGLTCFACGLAPAWAARGPNVSDALKQSARQAGARGQRRLAALLIFAEIACSVVLLIGSGLLFRSFLRVLEIPLGFEPEHALIVRTMFNRQRYPSADQRHQAERAITGRLAALAGVQSVALATHVPLADDRQIGFVVDGSPPDEFHWADNSLVSGGYFGVMGIPLVRGRTFTDADTPQAPPAAIINQSMARQYWPNQDPLGKGFRWGGRHLTVIGIAGDLHVQALDKPIGPAVYNSVYQIESGATTSGVFIVRVGGEQDPMQLAAAARDAIWAVDHGLPVLGFQTLHEVVATSLAVRRASLALVGGFAILAMVLALVGVYGVLSYAITQRTQEMGIRMALGATPPAIVRLVIVEGIRLASCGIVAGLAGAAFAASFVTRLLFGVRVLDPMTYTAGAAILLGTAVLASYLPARRASRVDPMTALRHD